MHTDLFYTIMFIALTLITFRKALEGRPAQEYTTLFLLAFFVARMVGMKSHPVWFERHSESLHVVWRAIKVLLQVLTVAFGWHYPPGPPLPYLANFDWIAEGIVPVLCTQVCALEKLKLAWCVVVVDS